MTLINQIKEYVTNHPHLGEFMRFGVTGVVSTITNYCVYYLLLWWLGPTLSFTVAYLVAMLVNYIMTTAFTFRVNANVKNGMGFVVSNVINYGLNVGFLHLFIWLGVPTTWAPVPMYAICVPINFVLVKYVMKKI